MLNLLTHSLDGEEHTARLMTWLGGQNVRQIAQPTYDRERLVIVEFRGGDWWTLCDNGGELNVERINDAATLVSVPTSTEPPVSIETIGYRVLAVLRGEAIDYGFRIEGEPVHTAWYGSGSALRLTDDSARLDLERQARAEYDGRVGGLADPWVTTAPRDNTIRSKGR